MRVRRFAPLLLLILCGSALCGCAAPSITLESLEPAHNPDAAKLRRLAVGAFRNDDGGVAASAVESALAGVSLGDKPYFTMVAAGPVREEDIAGQHKRGRLAGVDGVVLGAVAESAWRDAPVTRQRSVCVAYRENGGCRKTAMRDVRCVTRTGRFTFTPRLVNASSGHIVFAEELAESRESTACPGFEDESLKSGRELLAEARRAAVERLRDIMAPHLVRVRVPLLTDDDSGIPAPLKKTIADGVAFAQAGDMNRACSLWLGASGSHHAGYALPYLGGLCAEYAGDLDQAQADYERAAARAAKPVDEISAALARVRKARAEAPLLDAQTR